MGDIENIRTIGDCHVGRIAELRCDAMKFGGNRLLGIEGVQISGAERRIRGASRKCLLVATNEPERFNVSALRRTVAIDMPTLRDSSRQRHFRIMPIESFQNGQANGRARQIRADCCRSSDPPAVLFSFAHGIDKPQELPRYRYANICSSANFLGRKKR